MQRRHGNQDQDAVPSPSESDDKKLYNKKKNPIKVIPPTSKLEEKNSNRIMKLLLLLGTISLFIWAVVNKYFLKKSSLRSNAQKKQHIIQESHLEGKKETATTTKILPNLEKEHVAVVDDTTRQNTKNDENTIKNKSTNGGEEANEEEEEREKDNDEKTEQYDHEAEYEEYVKNSEEHVRKWKIERHKVEEEYEEYLRENEQPLRRD